METPERILLDRKSVAAILSLSLRTVDALLSSGELPATRIGRRIFVHRDALEKFARRNHPVVARGGGQG